MESIEVNITVRRNGTVTEQITRRVEVQESQGFSILKANDGDITTFTEIPAEQLDTIQAFVLRTDKAVTVRFNGQSDAGILLNTGGIIIVFDATINAGSAIANASVNNNSGAPALLEGFAAGE